MRKKPDRKVGGREISEVDLDAPAELITSACEDAERDRHRIDGSETLMIEELVRTHQQLVDAFDVVPEGIALFDADGRYVLWNQRYAEIYGSVLETIAVGARFEDVVRAALAKGLILDAVGREEEWLAERLAEHRKASHSFEHHMVGDRWIRAVERHTANGGRVSVRTDITELKQREASFRLLFESNPIPMFVCNAKTLAFLAANEAAASHYGYSQQQFLSMSIYDLRRPEDREGLRHRALIGDVVPPPGTIRPHIRVDGTQIDVAIYSRPMSYQGEPAVIFAAVDVTERQRAEARLQEQKLLTDAAVNNMAQGLVMFDADGRLVLWNQRYMEMYSLSPNTLRKGITFLELMKRRKDLGLFNGDPDELCRLNFERVAAGTPWSFCHEFPDGRTILAMQRPMPNGGWVSTHEDITERREADARMVHMALHDSLTDLPNRDLFRQRLEETLATVRRAGSLAVLFFDLDRFKIVNDTLGHAIGDELLKSVAVRLRDCVRETDILARLGGDEFAVVQTALAQPEGASRLALRILDAIKQPIEIEGHQISINSSIGIAIAPNDGDDPNQLLKNADMALYAAKALGRGTFHFFEPKMDAQVRARRDLELDLRKALANDEFELHYQPLINLQSNAVCGFEALLRWQHPERGLVSPDAFIAFAEELGLLVPIGEWVLTTACAEASTWPCNIKLAVNLSPAQLTAPRLAETVASVLATTGLEAPRLELEITEQALLGESHTLHSNLNGLRELGVQLVMDDFGVGFCSLDYLRRFSFDKIKIDRSFVKDIGKKSDATAIVRAVVSLASSLHMTSTAEGVETQQQLDAVRALGCTEVQGYLFSAPMRVASISRSTPPSARGKATAA